MVEVSTCVCVYIVIRRDKYKLLLLLVPHISYRSYFSENIFQASNSFMWCRKLGNNLFFFSVGEKEKKKATKYYNNNFQLGETKYLILIDRKWLKVEAKEQHRFQSSTWLGSRETIITEPPKNNIYLPTFNYSILEEYIIYVIYIFICLFS